MLDNVLVILVAFFRSLRAPLLFVTVYIGGQVIMGLETLAPHTAFRWAWVISLLLIGLLYPFLFYSLVQDGFRDRRWKLSQCDSPSPY